MKLPEEATCKQIRAIMITKWLKAADAKPPFNNVKSMLWLAKIRELAIRI
jgi:hypothetical protein